MGLEARMNGEPPSAVFTPDNEPYLGRPSVFHFDQIVQALMEQQHRIARITSQQSLSALQIAASEIAPGAASIGLAIRELVRQGYLFAALVLLRPLVERVGTLAYLVEHPGALGSWQSGWPYRDRPSFAELLSAMRGSSGEDALDEAKLVAGRYHALVHGGPDASIETLVQFRDGFTGFSVSKDLHSPERADAASFEATMYLIVLMATLSRVFPDLDGLEVDS
jgi:hypothetical protein